MKTLSNGAIAVGGDGSWMRLQSAYEHELQQAYEAGVLWLKDGESIAKRAEKMLNGIINRTATASDSLKKAAKACGIKPTEKAIADYLKASNYQPA